MNLALSWLIEGIGVALIATLVARLIPAGSPAQRHAFWWLALAGMLALPFLPDVHLSGVVTNVSASNTSAVIPTALTVPAPPTWLPVAALCTWVALALVSLTRLLVNLRAVRRLASDARPLPAHRIDRFQRFADACSGSRPARVCVSGEIRGACAVGFRDPRIMLSSDLVATLDDEAIEAIVLHEYAHLQRYDDWTRLLQQFVLSLVGIHPGVRWASRQIDIECEAACDRLVVARTGEPVSYARSLTAAAQMSARMSGLTPIAAPGAAMRGRGLHARVARLLAAVPVPPWIAWGSAGASAVAVVFATAASADLPPMIIVATFERPILALASVPLRPDSGAPSQAALVAISGEQRPVAVASPPVADTVVRHDVETGTLESIAAAAVNIEPPAPAAVPREESIVPVMPADPLPPSAIVGALEPPVPLASRLLPLAIHAPAAAASPRPTLDAPRETGSISIGSGAARLGVVTGDVAARAGTSIGRFFKNGGLAIASGF